MTLFFITEISNFLAAKDIMALREMRSQVRGVVKISEEDRDAVADLLETAIDTLAA
jgi:hypothetical protein